MHEHWSFYGFICQYLCFITHVFFLMTMWKFEHNFVGSPFLNAVSMTFDISTKASVKIQIFSEKKFIYKNKSENVNKLEIRCSTYQTMVKSRKLMENQLCSKCILNTICWDHISCRSMINDVKLTHTFRDFRAFILVFPQSLHLARWRAPSLLLSTAHFKRKANVCSLWKQQERKESSLQNEMRSFPITICYLLFSFHFLFFFVVI